ncbi:AAA-like domain protein [Planctomycetes bacterium Poly30]|uniref:AAA-like domain protein n=1 Tax=Saltatorellus ferox TaxID=2528018 RepID=A0A518EWF3_9BACT|nr:AAA-like domain protein [Planctomycetes bacterium Poly30]
MSKPASPTVDYEKLGAFYLGREVDPATGETLPGPLLYDSKDLCTHAVIVGMTGSGKTGLGVGLLEEAAIDGVPAIIVDPKGDMGNLALNFPQLRPEDFEPWVDAGEAQRAGKSVPEHAKATAEMWEKGIGKWDQDKARIKRLAHAAEVKIWTPGSKAGNPITMLKSFDAPAPAVIRDAESLGDRVQATTAGLLSLVGIDPDPVKSREAILIANILQHYWSRGENLGIGEMIGAIQSPPFEKLGVLDVETFYPRGDRASLAMRLNGLLASPGFAAWLEGEPLEIQRLLYAPDGRPRLSVLSLSHLSDEERMSFVTVLLGEILSWVRTQPGTSSLRALLYMDEIFGYFPPTANPPSKKPMLTLLKQARAFGLGVVLSTQNPVDLDYKGLSNCGTWFLGRLQTERDKLRVLDGLQGSLGEGGGLDRSTLEKMLSGMEKRTFLLHNVHEEKPALFQTRWVLSYLRGPLTRPEIERVTAKDKMDPPSASTLKAETKERAIAAEESAAQSSATLALKKSETFEGTALRPEIPEGIAERFLPLTDEPDESATVLYRPGLYVEAKAHYASSPMNVDHWVTFYGHAPIGEDEPALDWEDALIEDKEILAHKGGKRPRKGAQYADLPSTAKKTTTWARWHKGIQTQIYQAHAIECLKDKTTKLVSDALETPAAFRARTRQAHVEARDLALEKLRAKFATKIDRAQEQVRKAHERLGVQEEQLEEKSSNSWLSMGSSLLGALFSRKKLSATNMRSAKSALNSRTKVAKEKQDVERAERELKEREEDMRALEAEFKAAIDEISEVPAARDIELDEVTIRARKSDFDLSPPVLLWTPWIIGSDGVARRG